MAIRVGGPLTIIGDEGFLGRFESKKPSSETPNWGALAANELVVMQVWDVHGAR